MWHFRFRMVGDISGLGFEWLCVCVVAFGGGIATCVFIRFGAD